MKKQQLWMFVLLLTLPNAAIAQREYIRWNIFDINKVRTKFSNANELCDGNFQNIALAKPPAFEYPANSGISYGTDVAFIIAGRRQTDALGSNPHDEPYVEAGMTEGPADYWDPDHFDPYKEFVGGDRAAMSDDPESWPSRWPKVYPTTTIPVLLDSTGWPGAGTHGERLGDQEMFSVCYATDHLAERPPERWLKVNTITRGMAWSGKLYEDFIVWEFIVHNYGQSPVDSAIVGIWSDFSFLPAFLPPYPYADDADAEYYDRTRQLAYGWDTNGYEPSPNGGTLQPYQIAWAGTVVLKTPKGDDGKELGVTAYDAFDNWKDQDSPKGNGARKTSFYWWNMLNLDDPNDSDGDHIDDTFPDPNGSGTIDYYVSSAQPAQLMASGPFTLKSGEFDTLIVATVFGENKKDLFKNVDVVRSLFRDHWKVVRPPAKPRVTAIPNDQEIILKWNRQSEQDPDFEGYRIYRSTDHGVTWGTPITDDNGTAIAYAPYAQFDRIDGISGTNPLTPWLYLGSESGLESLRKIENGDTINVFVDKNVVNGFSYRYAVCAYTKGSSAKPPVENSTSTPDPDLPNDNVVEVVPNAPVAKANLNSVIVVPNPYILTAAWEVIPAHFRLEFTHLPVKCTIRIYNQSGELVRILEHRNGKSTEPWDLLNDCQQKVAAGLYFYQISGRNGRKMIGKFAIIN